MSDHKYLDTFSKNIQSIQHKRSSKIQRIIYAATLGMVSFFAEGNVESADAVHEALAGICKDLEMECIHLTDITMMPLFVGIRLEQERSTPVCNSWFATIFPALSMERS
jgi:hypothetical protein